MGLSVSSSSSSVSLSSMSVSNVENSHQQNSFFSVGEAPIPDSTTNMTSIARSILSRPEMINGRFICNYPGCKKDYKCISTLQRHKRIHLKIGLLECNRCKNGFDSLSALKRHKQVHTGVKPFSCPYEEACGKKFATKSSAKKHLMVIHSSYKTPICTDKNATDCSIPLSSQVCVNLFPQRPESSLASCSTQSINFSDTLITPEILSSSTSSISEGNISSIDTAQILVGLSGLINSNYSDVSSSASFNDFTKNEVQETHLNPMKKQKRNIDEVLKTPGLYVHMDSDCNPQLRKKIHAIFDQLKKDNIKFDHIAES